MVSLTQWTWVWARSRVGEGQGSLTCCSPWDRKESDTKATKQQQQNNWVPSCQVVLADRNYTRTFWRYFQILKLTVILPSPLIQNYLSGLETIKKIVVVTHHIIIQFFCQKQINFENGSLYSFNSTKFWYVMYICYYIQNNYIRKGVWEGF